MLYMACFKALLTKREREIAKGSEKEKKITKRDSYVNPKKYINLTF